MKILNSLFFAGVASTLCLFDSISTLAGAEPVQDVFLRNFVDASEKAGFVYGGYSSFPDCVSTLETVDGQLPVALICPKDTGERGGAYATKLNDTVAALSVSIIVNLNANEAATKYAIDKVSNVSQAFLSTRYNAETNSIEKVMTSEIELTLDGVEATKFVDDNGNSCQRRTRDLSYVGTFETTTCRLNDSTIRIAFWF